MGLFGKSKKEREKEYMNKLDVKSCLKENFELIIDDVFTIILSPFSNCSLEIPRNPRPTCSVLYPQSFDFRSFVCTSTVVILVSKISPFAL